MKKSLVVLLFLAFIIFGNFPTQAFPTPLKWPTIKLVGDCTEKEKIVEALPFAIVIGHLFLFIFLRDKSPKSKELKHEKN